MSVFQIDTSDLLSKSQAVESTITRIQTDVGSMEMQLRQLQDSWKGSASLAFQDVITQWKATQVQVEQSLSSIRQAMAAASIQYDEAETANTQLFGR